MLDEESRRRLENGYREFGDEVWRAVYAYSGSRREIADEAVAEAFAQAGRGLTRIRDVRAWIFRAAFRIAGGELKRRPESWVRVADDVEPDGMADLLDLTHALSRAQRRAVVLRDVLGFSTAETARLMGSSDVAVRVHLHTAHKRLRAHCSRRRRHERRL